MKSAETVTATRRTKPPLRTKGSKRGGVFGERCRAVVANLVSQETEPPQRQPSKALLSDPSSVISGATACFALISCIRSNADHTEPTRSTRFAGDPVRLRDGLSRPHWVRDHHSAPPFLREDDGWFGTDRWISPCALLVHAARRDPVSRSSFGS